jgi:hypothetical protein
MTGAEIKKAVERFNELVAGYFTGLDDLIATIKDAGYEVESATMEEVSAWYQDGTLYNVKIKWIDDTMLTYVYTA